MKSSEDIKNEYKEKIIAFSYKKEEESKVSSNGAVRDQLNDIYVTDICAWDTYCPKQIYYNKVSKRPALPEALIRFTIGHVVHEIPLWDSEDQTKNGHEQAFTWNGIRCRMDEINFEEGIIIDKKTVASLPLKPKDYVTKQLNVYRVIAEENTERPTPINQLFVINLAVTNGQIQVQEIPMWNKEETKNFISNTMNQIKHHVQNRIPPSVEFGSKGWICEGCQYPDLCKMDSSNGRKPEFLQSSLFPSEEKIKIKVNKK